MPRRIQCVLLALGTLGVISALPNREAQSYGYGSKGPAEPWTPDPWPTEPRPADPWTPDPWPAEPHGHVDRYGPVHSGGGYGHVDRYGPVKGGGDYGRDQGGYSECKEGFYGQCKKDQWGQCINPDFVGVWEFTEESYADPYADPYGHPQQPLSNRWLLQVDEYDFCKQSGSYRITNGKGLTESVAYGTYIWADKNLFKMTDYSYAFEYKYPHSIAGSVVWDSDVSLDGYGENAWTVKPAVGITKDLYGKVVDEEFSTMKFKKLECPRAGYGH